jgi:predicted metal-binding membrane protein
MFAAGYLAVWTAFSFAATVAQLTLARTAVLTNALTVAPILGAAILGAAGIYQFTPWKSACLRHCQSPVAFFMTRWRDGAAGAFRMGLQHGTSCVGCCWMLMALLFVAGVMNLVWVASITIFVLLEKLIPYPRAVSLTAGCVLITAGVIVLFQR